MNKADSGIVYTDGIRRPMFRVVDGEDKPLRMSGHGTLWRIVLALVRANIGDPAFHRELARVNLGIEKVGDDDEPRVRRSDVELDAVKKRILGNLGTRARAVSIGDVARALDTTSRDITHVMGLLVDEGRVVLTGMRRGTKYELPKGRRSSHG